MRKKWAVVALALVMSMAGGFSAQERTSPPGEWRYQSGDAWGTRFSPPTRSTPATSRSSRSRGFSAATTSARRRTPTRARRPPTSTGMLYSVAGQRRTVVAMDPKTGEVRLDLPRAATRRAGSVRCAPATARASRTREVDGRGVIYITSPGFFLHALDAKTGQPLENWGRPVPLPGFPQTRRRRPRRGSDPGLGPVAEVDGRRQEVRPGHGHSARARLHHELLAADRRQRRRRRRELGRAGLQPDAHRERSGRHPRATTRGPASTCGSST